LKRLEEMIPYMDLNEQVDADFTRARRRIVSGRLWVE
jgi:hypothetical protein